MKRKNSKERERKKERKKENWKKERKLKERKKERKKERMEIKQEKKRQTLVVNDMVSFSVGMWHMAIFIWELCTDYGRKKRKNTDFPPSCLFDMSSASKNCSNSIPLSAIGRCSLGEVNLWEIYNLSNREVLRYTTNLSCHRVMAGKLVKID